MDRQQIETLHDQASERYLEGDYAGALQMWDRLLSADPSDSRAQEGVRLCRLLAETSSHGAPAAEDEPGERPDGEPEVRVEAVQDELDVALSAFDGLLPKGAAEADTSPDGAIPDADTSPGAHAREAVTSPGIEEEPPEPAPHEKPSSEDLALDFELDATGLGPESDGHADDVLAADGAPPDLGEMLLDQDGEPEGGSSASGELEPVESNPAEEELRRRVRDLLDDARTAASEGRREKALTVLGRLFILDENNVEGRALQQSLQESKTEAEGEMDRRVADGVRLLQEGNRDGARDLFLSVLDEVPDHAEARAQLDRLEGVETGDGDPGELQLGEFAPDTFDQVADHGAVDLGETERGEEASELPLAGGAAAGVDRDAFGSLIGVEGHAAEEPAEAVEPVGAELPEEPTSRSSSRLLLVVALVVAVAAGGGFTAWKMGMLGFLPGAETGAEPQPPGVERAGPVAEAPEDLRTTEDLLREADRLTGGTASLPTGTDAERFDEMMRRGRAAIEEGDYAAAVLAFNEAIQIDPDHPDSARAFLDAGRMYRARQMQLEELHRAEQSFQAGDYVSALRSLYRLPEDLRPADVHRYKVNAWYNLGVVSLRAGDTEQAMEHLDEVLAMEPEDARAVEAREIAERYDGQLKDRVYYGEVENLEFRGLDS